MARGSSLPLFPPTLAEVARLAGVSRTVASRALSGAGQVSVGAREKVRSASDMLGYSPHAGARALARSRSDCVALVVSTGRSGPPFSAQLADVARGVRAALDDSVQLVRIDIGGIPDLQRAERWFRGRSVDGVIVVGDELARAVGAGLRGVPLVAGGSSVGDGVQVQVGSATRRLAHEVADTGHAHAAIVAGHDPDAWTSEFVGGILSELGRSVVDVEYTDYSYASGRVAARRILERNPNISVIHAASDTLAIGVIDEMERSGGRRVPCDVRVTGWGDDDSRSPNSPLTTVRVSWEEFGEKLGRAIEKDEAMRSSVMPQIVRGESA